MGDIHKNIDEYNLGQRQKNLKINQINKSKRQKF